MSLLASWKLAELFQETPPVETYSCPNAVWIQLGCPEALGTLPTLSPNMAANSLASITQGSRLCSLVSSFYFQGRASCKVCFCNRRRVYGPGLCEGRRLSNRG